MAWLSNEEFLMREDCREKKSIAASAHKQRTHCGKGGRARLPHERLTKKELMKLNGDCVTYKMSEPISWKEFKTYPDDVKKEYIEGLREKFNVPDKYIAQMLGCAAGTLQLYLKDLGCCATRGGSNKWDRNRFENWIIGGYNYNDGVSNPINPQNAPVRPMVTPGAGNLIFKDVDISDVLKTIEVILGGQRVNVNFTWELAD